MTTRRSFLMLATGILSTGCTRVVVHKDPGPHDHGFRYYRPKPYIFIGPAGVAEKNEAATTTKPAEKPKGKDEDAIDEAKAPQGGKTDPVAADNHSIKVSMEIKYLPDYNEEYSLRLRPGIGTGKLNFTLQDGWNLTTVGMETDQKLPELISSISGLIGSLTGIGGGASPGKSSKASFAGGETVIVDSRPDVPLGFYEAIIAKGPHGEKHLFGWRYVGFMPFAGCPVNPCVEPAAITCSPNELYGIVATPNSIKFQRLTEIEGGITKYNPYYKMKASDGTVVGPAGPPAAVPAKE